DAADLVDAEVAIGPVRQDVLARSGLELLTVYRDRQLLGIERDEVRDALDFLEGSAIGPSGGSCIADVVVGREALVRAEGLPFDGLEGVGFDIRAGYVPARGKAGLVQHKRSVRARDEMVGVTNYEVSRGAADVDAMVRVGGVAEDALVLLVEGVHRAPRERDRVAQRAGLRWRVDVLPGAALGDLAVAADDVEPVRRAEIRVSALMVGGLQHTLLDVADREVGDGIPGRLEEDQRAVASGDLAAAEPDTHPTPERLEVEHPLRHRHCRDERPVRVAAERPLLPAKTHDCSNRRWTAWLRGAFPDGAFSPPDGVLAITPFLKHPAVPVGVGERREAGVVAVCRVDS